LESHLRTRVAPLRQNGAEVDETEKPGQESPKDDRPYERVLRSRMTASELLLWRFLKGRKLDGLKFRRQQRIGEYVVDFYCPEIRLAVELDGSAHENRIAYDAERDLKLRGMGIAVLRFTNEEVLDHWERVLSQISREAGDRQRFRY